MRMIPDIAGVGDLLVDNQCDVNNNSVLASEGEIPWDDIVNIGMKVWQIILDNKPVMHINLPVRHGGG